MIKTADSGGFAAEQGGAGAWAGEKLMLRRIDMAFIEKKPKDLNGNVFHMFDDKWALVTAGDGEKFNTMTVSWGAMGVLWGKMTAQCYIRPGRYTYQFLEKEDYYTISVYGKEFKGQLALCGAKSGRDIDKVKETGFTPVFDGETGAPYFEEAELVFVCRKIYYQDFDPEKFLTPEIEDNYPLKDYHRMYIGEIVKVLEKQK